MASHWISQKIKRSKIRRRLFERDGGRHGSRDSPFGHGGTAWVRCHYCGRWLRMHGRTPHDHANLAHLSPACLGGPYEADNLVFACHDCNQVDSLNWNFLGYRYFHYPALPAPAELRLIGALTSR